MKYAIRMEVRALRTNRPVLRCFALAALLCLFLIPGAAGAAEEEQTLRVGFPIQEGLTGLDENGAPTGYTYEYLQEIAQYTGWNYEYVVMEGDLDEVLSTQLDMLASGELDLLGALAYSETLAGVYDYAGYSYGTSYNVLAVPEEDTAINENSIHELHALRVAVLSGARTRIEVLEDFCRINGIALELVYCGDDTECVRAVQLGEADVLLSVDLSLLEGLRVVTKFSPQLFYFATTKGNTDVVRKLNRAILGINEADPYFTTELYEKYFSRRSDTLRLTKQEEAYIRGVDTLRVGILAGKAPLQDADTATGACSGITKDLLDYLSAQTGLSFEYVPVASSDELAALLDQGKLDLAGGVVYDYNTAQRYHVALSRPYINTQVVMVLGPDVDSSDLRGKRLALAKGMSYDEEFMGDVTWYDSILDCLEAVRLGDADYSYGNGYSVQYYYTGNSRYRDLILVPQSDAMQKLCVGVAKPADVTLLTILNKAILSISDGELQAMIYRNAAPPRAVTLFTLVESDPWSVVLGTLILTALAVVTLLIYYRAKIRLTRQAALENERYTQLCEISNEHLFEYDYRRDRLSVTARSALALGVARVRENYYFKLCQDQSPAAAAEREVFHKIRSEKGGTHELCAAFRDGRRRWYRITAKVICDRSGHPVTTVGKLTDIQSEREERTRLVDQAQRDGLTGLYNASTVRQMVEMRLERGDAGALLILDVDHFKQVNDQHGHFSGDQVLTRLADLLLKTFRRDDMIGRLGGDEFVIFMQGVRSAVVEKKCALLVSQAAALSDDGMPGITVSIGAAFSDGKMGFDRLYQLADQALYQVKEKGRNGYQVTGRDG